MAKPNTSRDHQTLQEHSRVMALLAALQALDDRRPCAGRFHQLMTQRCHREIPVQYERLFLHAPAGHKENTRDYRRGTQKSNRRRVPQTRV